jgi:predicted ATPase
VAKKDKHLNITNFSIKKLFGFMNVDIPIVDNRIILIGVNGTGKTTILTMLFYLLKGKWEELSRFSFNEISLEIDSKSFTYKFSDIEKYLFKSEKDIKTLKDNFFNENPQELYELIFGTDDPFKVHDIQKYQIDNSIDLREAILTIRRTYKKPIIETPRDDLPHLFKRHTIQFYPTFRRIEKDLNDIIDFSYNNQKITPYFHAKDLGIIHFGMHDAKKLIDKKLVDLAKAKSLVAEIDKLEPIATKILQKINWDLKETDNNINKTTTIKIVEDKEQDYDFYKIASDLENTTQGFAKTCNAYLSDSGKSIDYDSDNYLFKILSEESQEIELDDLSFGEKQIVSFFAELYLSNKNDYIIIIDEPELSLSVRWQKRFLTDILATGKCHFLMAVTHSPFVYTDLEEYRAEITRLCTME